MGDDGALGLARGARRVHDRGDVIERDDPRPGRAACAAAIAGFVGAAGAEQQRGRDVAEPGHRQRDFGQFGVVDHQDRRGVADDVVQLGHGEAGVERQEYRADPPARELHLQRIRGVQRQHRDPVAAPDLEPVAQMRGQPRNPAVELRVGELALAGEVDHRRLVRRAAAEMGDPVIMANRQGFLQMYRGLVQRDGGLYARSFSWRAYRDTVLRRVAGAGGGRRPRRG